MSHDSNSFIKAQTTIDSEHSGSSSIDRSLFTNKYKHEQTNLFCIKMFLYKQDNVENTWQHVPSSVQ